MGPKRQGTIVEQRSKFGRDYLAAAIASAIVMAVVMAVRSWFAESNEMTGPFSFLPAWPFYTRLGIPLVALAIAMVYSICAAIIRYLLCRRAQRILK
jgi:hypothetical protein